MIHYSSRRYLLGLVCLLLAACSQQTDPLPELHRTTAGGLASGNLDAQIAHWSSREEAADSDQYGERRSSLIHALVQRGRMRLSSEDFAKALTLAETWTARQPEQASAWLALAHAQGTVHRYEAAASSLNSAARLAAPAQAVATARCGLDLAQGRYVSALDCANRQVAQAETPSTLGFLAAVLGDLGRYEDAAAAYAKAWTLYRDPSPFLPAWLAFGEARMWMAAGDPARARALLAFMHERLPQHLGMRVEQAVALEESGEQEAAIAMLKPLLAQTDDPDVPNLLAIWLHDAGREDAARTQAEAAAQGYAQRLAKFPEAYAAHAVEYWLGPGDDAEKALALARANLDNGPSVAALALMADTALAAEQSEQACEAANRFLAVGEQQAAARREGSTAQAMAAIRANCE